MEFMIVSTLKPSVSPAEMREVLRVFSQWQPPTGGNLKFLYFATDSKTAFGLFETESAASLTEITSAFNDYLDFQVFPVMEAQVGAEILGRMKAWVDQVKG